MKKEPSSLLRFFAASVRPPEEEIQAALAALSERERAVVELRFGLKDGQSIPLQAVGQRFGVTGERVRQIESRALGKLRRLARSRPRRASDRMSPLETALPGSV